MDGQNGTYGPMDGQNGDISEKITCKISGRQTPYNPPYYAGGVSFATILAVLNFNAFHIYFLFSLNSWFERSVL